MDANLNEFLHIVEEIEANSWWNSHFRQRPQNPEEFKYVLDANGERITEVPAEALESLLLRVRHLTTEKSPANLHVVRKHLKGQASNKNILLLLDTWHHFWRLAFIKEPYLIQWNEESQVMTPYRAYNAYINGRYFHTDSRYTILLYHRTEPANVRTAHLYVKNQFHWSVASLCMAALGLRLFITGGDQWILSEQVAGVTDFIWCRNQLPQLVEQYKIFNQWIIKHNGGPDCRWKS